MAEKNKPDFDYFKDTDLGRFLEYADFAGEESIYNPYNIGTAFYDLAAVPMNKATEFFTEHIIHMVFQVIGYLIEEIQT